MNDGGSSGGGRPLLLIAQPWCYLRQSSRIGMWVGGGRVIGSGDGWASL